MKPTRDYSVDWLAKPTKSGNGFKVGQTYLFKHLRNGLYYTVLLNGERYECLDGRPSAHLWDGVNWNAAGHFVIVGTYDEE